jgi:hypothetical protein
MTARSAATPAAARVEEIFLRFDRAAGAGIGPSAKTLRHHARRPGPLRGRQQMVQTLGPQAVGDSERPIEPPQVVRAADGRHLVHDHVRSGGSHCLQNGGFVERIGNDSLAPCPAYDIGLGRNASQAHHGMAHGDEQRHEAASNGTGGARNEDSHGAYLFILPLVCRYGISAAPKSLPFDRPRALDWRLANPVGTLHVIPADRGFALLAFAWSGAWFALGALQNCFVLANQMRSVGILGRTAWRWPPLALARQSCKACWCGKLSRVWVSGEPHSSGTRWPAAPISASLSPALAG